MAAERKDDLLPVLVAELDDDQWRTVLEMLAEAGDEVCLPLMTAPVDGSQHILEVNTPGFAEPLVVLAEPLGPPTKDGFPLRVRRFVSAESGEKPAAKVRIVGPRPVLRARTTGTHNLSPEHTAALGGEGAAAPPSLIGRMLAGKLRIEEMVGEGGMGAVYRARHEGLHMPVAVKVLHASLQKDVEFYRRFQAEALAASRLDHPNLTRVLDFGQEPDGLVYLAMEFLDGVDLRTVLQRQPPLAFERIVDIMGQVCAGLAHVHGRGMVHRDLKPDNVVLVSGQDEEGQPSEVAKLCDFGIAVARGSSSEDIVGTPEYMSPEQCAHTAADARSDIYACGVLLYEMATGHAPFEGDPVQVFKGHLNADPVPPSHHRPVDPRLESIIRWALRKDPAERPQTARDLRHALRALLAPPASGPLSSSMSQPVSETPAPPVAHAASRPAPPPAVAPAPAPSAPPVAPPPAPVQAAPARPDWLEDNVNVFIPDAGPSRAAETLIKALTKEPGQVLTELVQGHDAGRFTALCLQLEEAIPLLAQRKMVALLWRIDRTLEMIAEQGGDARASRADGLLRVRRALRDPAVLAPAAEDMLAGPPSREASALIQSAGVAGAYALYGARINAEATPEQRSRFVQAMREIGAPAFPVLRAALAKLEGQEEAAAELIEDVLTAIPEVHDDQTGEVAARFLRSPAPAVRRVATMAVVHCWGERARALLLGVLQDPDELVLVEAIAGLTRFGGADEHMVRRLGAMLDPARPASVMLKTKAAMALRSATHIARGLAVTMLTRLMASTPVEKASDQALLLAIGRSLVALSGQQGRSVVGKRAAREGEPLRAKLLEL